MVAVGTALRAVILADLVPTAPSSSVAVNVASYVPSSSGVKLKLPPVAVLGVTLPFLVKVQARDTMVSSPKLAQAPPVSETGVPSVTLAGAPLMVTFGGAFTTVTLKVVKGRLPWPSFAVTVTKDEGPSSVAG